MTSGYETLISMVYIASWWSKLVVLSRFLNWWVNSWTVVRSFWETSWPSLVSLMNSTWSAVVWSAGCLSMIRPVLVHSSLHSRYRNNKQVWLFPHLPSLQSNCLASLRLWFITSALLCVEARVEISMVADPNMATIWYNLIVLNMLACRSY